MARRKKSLLLRKKKPSGKKASKPTPEGLSERQFAALLHDYSSFEVEDPEHQPQIFSTDDVVYIQHQDSEDTGETLTDNHWIGRIQKIRGNNPYDVWIQVQWYWSPQEVAEVIKSFDPSIFGKYEKLYSDNLDIISVHCVVAHVEVKLFDETNFYQVHIGDEEWFSRYEFHYNARKIIPKVTHVACPICKIPYTPGVEKILHFCPRPGCCKFYHQSCLVKNDYVEETHSYRILETWPETDNPKSVEELAGLYHPRKKQKKDSSVSKHSSNDPLADLPALLVAVAEQQIIRGAQGGGIVGNIASVVAARQLIFRALIGTSIIPDDWETTMDTTIAFPDSNTFPNCICPSCGSPI